jgi:predicted pyridoxine 5'-phosphate oxidase superfamily flavin-nucleotide-binding protein
MRHFLELAFTPAVRAAQERLGSREAYARVGGVAAPPDRLGEHEAAFLAARDSFYMASIGATGWPYVQHRGGPKGFVRVLDERTIAFADVRGNRQYVSVGNVAGDDRVALVFVDYPNQARMKILARATIVTDDEALSARVSTGERAERIFLLRVEGIDWNCPKNITPRFTEEEIRAIVAPIRDEIEALRRENARLRGASVP